jgi:hypothetical protein
MDYIISNNKSLNNIYISKYTNNDYNTNSDLDTNCHITKKLLLFLLECVKSDKSNSNFQTLYIEYKGFGHSCCIYNNFIYQSFEKYYYLQSVKINVSLQEIIKSIDRYIYLFYPKEIIDMNKEDNIYFSVKYYYTNIGETKIINNAINLIKK